MKQIKIRSTKAQLEKFKNSFVWKDMRHELLNWKKSFEQEPLAIVANAEDDNPSSAKVLMHLGDVHGRIKAVDFLLGLPDMFLNVLEDSKDDS